MKVLLTLRLKPAIKRALQKAADAENDTISHKAEVTLIAALRESGFLK
jgi:hypothetical protein